MKEPKWLPREAVLAMHARQLAEHGGSEGLRDEGMLESALQRAQNKYAYDEPDMFDPISRQHMLLGSLAITHSSTAISAPRWWLHARFC